MIVKIKEKIYSSSAFTNFHISQDDSPEVKYLDGLKGSLKSIFISYLVEVHKKFVVFLSSDTDSAEKIRDDLEVLLGEKQIVFFPNDEREPYDDHDPNPSLRRLRLETLRYLLEIETGTVVTTLDGLMNRVPSPEIFIDQQNYIKKDSQRQFQSFLQMLGTSGYIRTEIVEDVGHFAVRGGIIDIFPWSSDDPVRIEFFGDRVESIRSFNVISQRSIEEIDEIEILPNLESEENTNSLFDYLADQTVFVVEDYKILQDRAQEFESYISEKYQSLLADNVYPAKPSQRYLEWDEINDQLKRRSVFHFGLLMDSGIPQYRFESILPPTFAGHLNRLFSYLSKSSSNKIFTIIQCDSKSQAERLSDILEDENLDETVHIMVGALHHGFVLPELNLQVLTDHEIFDRFKRRRTYKRFKNGEYLRSLSALNLYDYVVHVEYGIGQYRGLHIVESGGGKRECIKIAYAEGDVLFVSVDRLNHVQKYASEEETIPKLTRLGSGEWERIKQRTKESIEKIAAELIEMQAARKTEKGYVFSEDTHWQKELEASFQYEETEDQLRSINEVKKDLEQDSSMDRLLCGDVGYGKTEVALRAAFKVVMDGKQVIILVPTTILAYQHFQTFKERMAEFPLHIEMLSRFRTAKDQKKIIEKLTTGEIDIVIGTHRLLSDDVKIKNLGLLVIDEEQRFGVKHKEKLKKIRVTVDVLIMTATPIPRTLHLSLMGARDLSHIETPPRNRLPVITEIHEWDDDLIYQAINREIERNGQVYFVHNRVKSIEGMKKILSEIVPAAKIVIAHGQLPERQLEKIMLDFIHKKYDVLISTMIIENGLDIPNVNTIIIDHADKFGLAQMYQLRGRVGRSNLQAYAYLLVPHVSKLTDLAQKRLRAIQDFTDLGSGFKIALRDMEIRGIGNILGKEQSGNIQAIGFDLYCKLIDESVHHYKSKNLPQETKQDLRRYTDAKLDVNFDLMIPEEYISSETERVSIYHRLVNFLEIKDLKQIKNELLDRFGPVPAEVMRIVDAIGLKILGGKIYASNIRLDNHYLVLRFSEDKNETEFHNKILTNILRYNRTKVAFSGEQENPSVKFSLTADTLDERIKQAKNILHEIQ